MSGIKPIRRIAVIGTGVIGASWTSLVLAKGLYVVASRRSPLCLGQKRCDYMIQSFARRYSQR